MKLKHTRRPQSKKRQRGSGPLGMLKQPPAGFYKMPVIELQNGRLLTDGCRRVLEFTPEKITLCIGRTILSLYGRELRIESLAGKRLIAAGHISKIEFAEEADSDDEPER